MGTLTSNTRSLSRKKRNLLKYVYFTKILPTFILVLVNQWNWIIQIQWGEFFLILDQLKATSMILVQQISKYWDEKIYTMKIAMFLPEITYNKLKVKSQRVECLVWYSKNYLIYLFIKTKWSNLMFAWKNKSPRVLWNYKKE